MALKAEQDQYRDQYCESLRLGVEFYVSILAFHSIVVADSLVRR